MTAFGFNILGHRYEFGLSSIERTYDAAHKALIDQKHGCYAQFEALRRGEIVDDYDPLDGEYSKEDYLNFEIDGIESSIQILRQSVLLMIYHFWEKQVLIWAGKKLKPMADPSEQVTSESSGKKKKQEKPSPHHAYVDYCQQNGLSVETQRMAELNLTVNLCKHGADWEPLNELKNVNLTEDEKEVLEKKSKQDRLFKIRPDMWKHDVQSHDPYDFLHLAHEHILEFFEAVRNSGPKTDGDFNPKPI